MTLRRTAANVITRGNWQNESDVLFNEVLSVFVLGELPGTHPGSGLILLFQKQTVQQS